MSEGEKHYIEEIENLKARIKKIELVNIQSLEAFVVGRVQGVENRVAFLEKLDARPTIQVTPPTCQNHTILENGFAMIEATKNVVGKLFETDRIGIDVYSDLMDALGETK